MRKLLRKKNKLTILAITSFLLLSFLFYKTEKFNEKDYQAIQQNWSELKKLDYQRKKIIFQSQIKQHTNYDLLDKIQLENERLVNDLLRDLSLSNDPSILQNTKILVRLNEHYKVATEQFKTNLAEYKISYYYIPILFLKFFRTLKDKPQHDSLFKIAQNLLSDLEVFMFSKRHDLVPAIESLLKIFQSLQSNQSLKIQKQMEIIHWHIHRILTRSKKFQTASDQLTSNFLFEVIENLKQQSKEIFSKQIRIQKIYKLLLIFFSSYLLILIIYLILQLRKNKNYLRSIIASMNDILLVSDSSGKIVKSNHSAKEKIVSPQEKKSDLLISKIWSFLDINKIAQSPDTSFQWEDIRHVYRDSSVCQLSITASKILNSNNQLEGLVFVARDITELKRSQSLKLSLQKQLDEVARHAAMAEITAQSAHEILNPLSSIYSDLEVASEKKKNFLSNNLPIFTDMLNDWNQSYSQGGAKHLVQKILMPSDPLGSKTFLDWDLENLNHIHQVILEESHESMRMCQSGATNLNRIRQIIDGMKQKLLHSKEPTESIDMRQIVDEITYLMSDEFETLNIKLETSLEATHPQIIGVKDELLQILQHLFKNSIEAFKTGRKDKRLILVEIKNNKEYLVIRITDNASGIQVSELPFIFEAGWSSADKTNKAGIGLSIVRRIIRHWGGDITVSQNIPGERVSFDLTLPLSA